MKRLAPAVLLLCAGPALAGASAQKVLDCMRANVPDTVRVDALELASYDRQGPTQSLKGRLYAIKETPKPGAGFMHAMLRIDEPVQFKGAAYLVRETDDFLRDGMFVYLPSVGRVRRVTGTFADGSMLGTSFSYFDFKQFAGAFGDLQATLDAPDTIEGRPVDVLSFKSLPGTETHYDAVRVWVDQRTCVVMRAEFSESGTVRKRFAGAASGLMQSNGYWYLTEGEMRDLRDDSRTVLRMTKVTSGAALPGRLFDATSFHVGN